MLQSQKQYSGLEDEWEDATQIILKTQLNDSNTFRRILFNLPEPSETDVVKALERIVCDRFVLQAPIHVAYIGEQGELTLIDSAEVWNGILERTARNGFGEKVVQIQVLLLHVK
jgi:hypothetical protein